MVYSSGTTGASKGIQLTNDGVNSTILQYEFAGFQMERQDRYFAQIPLVFNRTCCNDACPALLGSCNDIGTFI